jgi:O-antigen ligase
MVVSKSKLIFAVYAFTMLLPSFFSSSIFNACENLFTLIVLFTLFKKRYTPSKIVWAFGGYIIILLFSSVINQTSAVNIHLFVSNIKLILFFAVLDWYSRYNRDGTLKVLWWIIATISLLNFGSLILYPEGIHTITYVWNEWGASDEIRQWIVGNKNSQALWYIAFMLLTYYSMEAKYVNSNPIKKIVAICVSCTSFIAVFIVNSSTGMAAVIVVAAAVIICSFFNRPPAIRFNTKWILVIYVIVLFLLLLGNTSVFEPIVTGIFGKDLTFSNRIFVWAESLALIIQKPIIGYGFMDNDTMRELLGSLAYTSAHNQVLNTLLQGGIILAIALVAGFLTLLGKINRTNRRMKVICFFAVGAVLIEMLLEAILAEPIAWTVIFIIYILAYTDAQKLRGISG